ncbi:hypothetical protein ACLNGM_15040 [Aureimonas phyllosphaerae]|uniref:hypothetical protein n=1 Tax=Aureimonas phyllosphaerae TaxID=1166078 RepID=UPI003A5C60F7
MEDWNAIAAEVADALRSVADVSQPGGFPVVLRKQTSVGGDPWNPAFTNATDFPLHAIETVREVRDASGTLIGQSVRTLTVTAIPDVVPASGDTIAIGAAVPDTNTEWVQIAEVRPLAPAGIAVLYEIDLIA